MAVSDLAALTATAAAAEIARGALSALDYTRACLERIAALEGDVGAFVHLDPERALEQARALDRHKANGGRLGPLHGIPVGIKDIVDTTEHPAECGSPALAGRRPQADATVVAKLREAGAIVIGKTVTTEFAYFHPGKTRNPRDLERTPGGSSSGSAAAVAANMVPLAIGSQTNGSVIRPAAFCGVFSIKPSHGMVSRSGVLILSHALDHVGAFARSLEDLALIMDVMVGEDLRDPDSRAYAAPDFRARLGAGAGSRAPVFAFMRTPMWDNADGDVHRAFEAFAKKAGARDVEMPAAFRAGWDAHRAIMAADMASNLGAILDDGGEASQQFRDLIAEGRKVTAAHYLAARRDARRYAKGMSEILEHGVDAIITPSARGVAPKGTATGDPMFCTFWSLIGFPALNLPVLSGSEGLPIGVQLIGTPGSDARLLHTAKSLLAKAA